MNKEQIIAEIQRTAEENGGVPPGRTRFATITGVSQGAWCGKYWRTWSEAVKEAGFAPNLVSKARTKEQLILAMIGLLRKNRRFPTHADLRMEKQADDSFPARQAFNRLGVRHVRIALVRAYATEHEECRDVLDLLPISDDERADHKQETPSAERPDGAVYMLKLGRHYKIGKSFRVPQRHREIAIELPEKPDVVHVISTDDPTGIETYWHTRFAEKRTNGEWFSLSREDVRAFKRRRFM
jgi:hypothetical protein